MANAIEYFAIVRPTCREETLITSVEAKLKEYLVFQEHPVPRLCTLFLPKIDEGGISPRPLPIQTLPQRGRASIAHWDYWY